MTTPTHCTRTDPHPAHEVWIDVRPIGYCLGVEPPADVAATPDPRLDVVAIRARLDATTPGPWTAAKAPAEGSEETHAEYLTRSLYDKGLPLWAVWASNTSGDEFDYLVPAVTGDGPTSEANAEFIAHARQDVADLLDEVHDLRVERVDLRTRLGELRERYDRQTERAVAYGQRIRELESAPAGLSAAQEIRLRVFEGQKWKSENTADEWAAWVEHGPDETPDLLMLRDAESRVDELTRALALERARLGHIADALRDVDGGTITTAMFRLAVRDALAWTPDDTAPAGAATGDGFATGGIISAGASVVVGEGERFWVRDDDGAMREVHEAKGAPNGDA